MRSAAAAHDARSSSNFQTYVTDGGSVSLQFILSNFGLRPCPVGLGPSNRQTPNQFQIMRKKKKKEKKETGCWRRGWGACVTHFFLHLYSCVFHKDSVSMLIIVTWARARARVCVCVAGERGGWGCRGFGIMQFMQRYSCSPS